jgi:transposase-like protein
MVRFYHRKEVEKMGKRRFSPEEKYRILEKGRAPGASVAEVCRRYQISSTLFYLWEKQTKQGIDSPTCPKYSQKGLPRLRCPLCAIAQLNHHLFGYPGYLKSTFSQQDLI